MSISMSSTTGFGFAFANRSPSPSESAPSGSGGAGGVGAGAGVGSGLPPAVAAPSFKRTFAVSSLKSLNRRQNYVLVLDFEKSLVSFHKVRKGKEVKRSFPFAACVKLERGNGSGGSGSGSVSGMGGGGGATGGAKGATALVATFGHEPKYKKSLFFASNDERELFCNLVHAMIVSGSRAVPLFKSLQAAHQTGTNGTTAPGPAASPALLGSADGKDAAALSGSDAHEVVAGMDFCDFLISFSSAQTQLSHSQALSSTAKTAGAGAAGAGKAAGFDEHDLAIGGGRARANANDPQAAILQFLQDNGGENGAGGINGLATSNLISLLNGRLLEGETPINSSDISYRVECECGGMSVVPLFKRSGAGGGGSSGGSGASRAGISPALAHASSNGSSHVEVSAKDGTGTSASSRGLFLLTNYRILYINYNEHDSYAAREAAMNFEAYAPWANSDAAMVPAEGQDGGAGAGGDAYAHSSGRSSSSHASHPAGSHSNGVCTCDADIPLGLISKVSRSSTRGNEGCEVRLSLKDGRKIEFGFDAGARWVEGLVENIGKLAWPKDQSKLFAFSYAYKAQPSQGLNPLGGASAAGEGLDGWKLYDALADYTRVTLATDPTYRIVTSNLDYKLCASYPRLLMLPQALRDDEIKQIASYRSQSRLPAVVWVHPLTRASLSRCAQPLVGLNRKRSELDEKLVTLLRLINPSNPHVLHILDARPWKAAVGNTAMGKGFENIQNYDGATLQFCSIDNIHHVRSSLSRLTDLCTYGDASSAASGSSSYYYATSSGAAGAAAAQSTFLSSASSAASACDETFLSKLEGSMWMHYVRLVLAAAQRIAVALSEEGASCMTHCSDGWDRTSQLSALSQLMLDPFYRTLEGFAILIEKEWLSFGHRFAERYGHASAEHDDEQRAPIFLQFLDCVFQLTHQFPSSFEFTDDYLIAISDHVGSHRFGTFLWNCAQERDQADLRNRTVSLWTFLLHPQIRTKFYNAAYVHPPHVKRWSVADVKQCDANMAALVQAAKSQAALDAAAVAAGRGSSSAPYALHAPAPSCSGTMPPIAPLSSSPSAPIIASFFCIPSVASRRLVLWQKMHLRHDREFLRTQMQIQSQIALRVSGAAAARLSLQQQQQQQATAAAAATPDSKVAFADSGAAAPTDSSAAAPSGDIDGAWAARYALLKKKILDAGIDIHLLETMGTVVRTGDKPVAASTGVEAGAGVGMADTGAGSTPAVAGLVVSPRSVQSGVMSSPNASDSDTQSFSASPSSAAAAATATGAAVAASPSPVSVSPRRAVSFVTAARVDPTGSPLVGSSPSSSPPPPPPPTTPPPPPVLTQTPTQPAPPQPMPTPQSPTQQTPPPPAFIHLSFPPSSPANPNVVAGKRMPRRAPPSAPTGARSPPLSPALGQQQSPLPPPPLQQQADVDAPITLVPTRAHFSYAPDSDSNGAAH